MHGENNVKIVRKYVQATYAVSQSRRPQLELVSARRIILE
jgi:hypothetical protein